MRRRIDRREPWEASNTSGEPMRRGPRAARAVASDGEECEGKADRRRPQSERLKAAPSLANEGLELHYTAQRIVPGDEWPAFLATLRTPLPTALRINPSAPHADKMRER